MLTMNDIRQGVTIVEDGDPWVVITAEHLKKSKLAPVMRTKIRNLITGQVKNRTFKQGESIEEAEVTVVGTQFLYESGGEYAFMNQENYEQYALSRDKIGDGARYLREGMEVEVLLFEGSPVAVKLPLKVDFKVIATAPGVRGDSASNVMKEATLEGGIRLQVPLFVKEGDIIRVDTRTGEYVERVGGGVGGGSRKSELKKK